MTQCSFIGSVAFALRCARRSRFTTLSRIFPPSLSVSLALSVSRSPRRPCFSLVSPFRLSSFLFPRQLPLFHATFPAVQPLSDASFPRKIAWHSLLIRRSTTYRWRYFRVEFPRTRQPTSPIISKNMLILAFLLFTILPDFSAQPRDKWKSNVIYTRAIGKLIRALSGRK